MESLFTRRLEQEGVQADGILPAEFELLPQRGEALGERMALAFEDLFPTRL